jgi:hypothetical protein
VALWGSAEMAQMLVDGRIPSMIPNKPVPDLIPDGHRFLEKIMLHEL